MLSAAESQQPVVGKGAALTAEAAEQLVVRWMGVKAAALGDTHDTQELGALLGGNMLKEWKLKAEKAAQEGW